MRMFFTDFFVQATSGGIHELACRRRRHVHVQQSAFDVQHVSVAANLDRLLLDAGDKGLGYAFQLVQILAGACHAFQ